MQTYTPCGFAALIFCLLTCATTAQAQQSSAPASNSLYNQVSIASPTAASLGKYADIPVNNHTGIPEISIPFYTVKDGNLSLPISLSYHAGGIKVQEPASWVGTGWALNAGGVITRSVMDKPDERGTTNATKGHFSDYGYNSYWEESQEYGVGLVCGTPSNKDENFAANRYDGEPDLYFFNFNGYTGKFFFSDDRTPVVVDGQDLKIEYYYPIASRTGGTLASFNIQGFIITVPTGDKYYFGITDNNPPSGASPVETTHSSTDDPLPNDDVYSSYYLTKVVAADGVHSIRLTYATENYSYYTLALSPLNSLPLNGGPCLPVGNYRKEYRLVNNNIDGVRLSQISFSNGTVTLNPATTPRLDLGKYLNGNSSLSVRAKALGSISISATDFCKQYNFSYGYFNGDTTPLASGVLSSGTYDNEAITADINRLRLERVQEVACDGTVSVSPWTFRYNGTFLPRRLSFAQDHWGFYNGQTNNNTINTLIPTYYEDSDNAIPICPGANREAAWPAMASGLLTKVTYPTRGSTSLVYEPNDTWVSYPKHQYQSVLQRCVGTYCGANLQNFSLTFSGNAYRIALDYSPDRNNNFPGGASVGPATSRDLPLSLSVSRNKLHDEIYIQPAAGTQSSYLVISNISASAVESAIVSVYENVPVRIEDNVLAGGVRVKTVTTREGAAAPEVVTRYTYRDSHDHSTGTLYSRPRYVQVVRNNTLGKVTFSANATGQPPYVPWYTTREGCLLNAFTPFIYQISPCSIIPMTTTQGNHLGYDQVSVTQAGNGRTDYYYYGASWWTNYNDVCIRNINKRTCDLSVPNWPSVPLPYDFSRGQLKYQRVFNEQGQLVKDFQYTYAYDSSRVATPAYVVKYVGEVILGSQYTRRAYWKKRTQVVEMDLTAGQSWPSTRITTYDSPYHRQATREIQYLPTRDTLVTRHTYTFDLPVPPCDALADGTVAYERECASCDAILRQQLQTTTDYALINAYNGVNWRCRADARMRYVAYRRRTFLDNGNTYQTLHNAALQNADALLKPVLRLQDAYRNELIETSHWKNSRLLSASYTRFGPGLTQPAVLYPLQQFSLSLQAPSVNFTPIRLNNNSLFTDSRYATTPEHTLKFDQGNVVEIAPKQGPVASYLWGYNNTLPVAEAKGVDYATLQAAYNQTGGNLSALRGLPTLSRALLTTYAHRPLVGMTSQTDPAGRTTTYEYDALGRLVRARDEQGRVLSQQQYHYARP